MRNGVISANLMCCMISRFVWFLDSFEKCRDLFGVWFPPPMADEQLKVSRYLPRNLKFVVLRDLYASSEASGELSMLVSARLGLN